MVDYCMAMTTIEGDDAARGLARKLVEARLAACVQITAIHSVYRWKGSVTESPELLLLMKTRADLYDQLETFISEHHPYDVPEVLQIPIANGFGPYLSWVDEMTVSPPRA